MREYPDITVELVTDEGLTDIVSARFDAGVRVGEFVEKDMIAVRIGPEMRQAIVGTPDYFKTHPVPKRPEDLTDHRCINLRRVTRGGYFPWEFEKRGREINVRVEGQLAVNSLELARSAALDGLGLAYLPDDLVEEQIARKQLVRVLEDWCEPLPRLPPLLPKQSSTCPRFCCRAGSASLSRLNAAKPWPAGCSGSGALFHEMPALGQAAKFGHLSEWGQRKICVQ